MAAIRLLSGGVFVVFGIGKFVNHASELAPKAAAVSGRPGRR